MSLSTITTLGSAALDAAKANNVPLVVTHVAVGDGGGSPITPDPSMTALVNETARVVPFAVESRNLFDVVARGAFPNVGLIREVGLFDATGTLIAIASVLQSTVSNGAPSALAEIDLAIDDPRTSSIGLTTTDPQTVASRQFVDDSIADPTPLVASTYVLGEDFDATALNARLALTGTGSVVDDSAAGAFGAFKLNPGSGASANLKTSATFASIAGDFKLEIRIRLPNAIASGDSGFILITDAAASHFVSVGYAQGTTSNHWYAQIESNAVVDLGALPSSTYQLVAIERRGSLLRFLIDDVQKYSATYSAALDAGKVEISVSDGGAASAEFRLDSFKLYVAR